ncbi:MAG: GrpB family protein [Phycisphaeraceae bacterium]|nr:GrpB family protein [Phycisphaeraceae bacterium]
MPHEIFYLSPTRPAARAAERLFRRERTRIRRRIPGAIIEHIGATAIRNFPTKGDLDIVVRVDSDAFPETDRALSRLYLRNTANKRTTDFASFKDDESHPPLGVQLAVIGSGHDDFDLLRDQLRVSVSCRRSLARLKRRFAGRSMNRYRRAKGAEIERISKKEPLATLLAGRRSRTKPVTN